MRSLVLIVVLACFSAGPLWAKAYSCRDSSGQTHFSDSQQGLPEECRDQGEVVKSGTTGNLNLVPGPRLENSGIQPGRGVQAAEREQAQKQELAQQLRNRAEALSAQYRQAAEEKWQAKTGWNTNKRKHVKVANDKLLQILEGKQRLLLDLDAARVPTRDKNEIREILAELDEDINAE